MKGMRWIKQTSSSPKLKIRNRLDEADWILGNVEKILQRRRNYISRLDKDVAIILMSGGMDSTILADMLLKKTALTLYPLFVKRGARAEKYEEEAFDYFCNFFMRRYPLRFLAPQKIKAEVPPAAFKKYNGPTQLNYFGHPMRNVALQILAVQYAHRLRTKISAGVHCIITATVPDDLIPHSSLLATRVATLMTCIDTGDWEWNIIAPLIDPNIWDHEINKKYLIDWANKNRLPIEKTRTCTQSCVRPCSKCLECKARAKAFRP